MRGRTLNSAYSWALNELSSFAPSTGSFTRVDNRSRHRSMYFSVASLCLSSAHPVFFLEQFTQRLPKHFGPFRRKLTRGHFRKNTGIVKGRAQPVTGSTRLNVEALTENDVVHEPAVFFDVQLKEYQATTRSFERQDQANGTRVEERVGSSPRPK